MQPVEAMTSGAAIGLNRISQAYYAQMASVIREPRRDTRTIPAAGSPRRTPAGAAVKRMFHDPSPWGIGAPPGDHDHINGSATDEAGVTPDTRDDGHSAVLLVASAAGAQYDAVTDDQVSGEDSSARFFRESSIETFRATSNTSHLIDLLLTAHKAFPARCPSFRVANCQDCQL